MYMYIQTIGIRQQYTCYKLELIEKFEKVLINGWKLWLLGGLLLLLHLTFQFVTI